MEKFIELGVPGIMAVAGLYFLSAAVNGRFFFYLRKPDPDSPVTKEDRERAGAIGGVLLLLGFFYAWSGVFA